MVEVDPRLFVTCRLCLEVEGQFQIIPSVQEQIKYCFDIDVEPFDCLPQLVCRKCQQILSQYYNIKQNFLEKQKELRAKVQENVKKINKLPSPQISEPASSPGTVNNKSSRKKKHKSKKVRKRISVKQILSSSSDELDHNDLSIHSPQKSDSDSSSSLVSNKSSRRKNHKTKKVRRISTKLAMSSSDESDHNDTSTYASHIIQQKYNTSNEKQISWEDDFCKYLVCRICSQKFQNKEGIRKHIRAHSNIHTKYKNIFNISCLVVMEKIDGKTNVTKSDKAVVYSSDSYIENEHNPYYYTMYHPKNHQFPPNESAHQSDLKENNDSTIQENVPRKKRRITSRSSNETVVNERRHDITQVIDCIDIDDSSDTASCQSNDKSQTSSVDYKNDDILDSKSVNNIIKMCYNRYSKRFDLPRRKIPTDNVPTVSTLHHKVLSIGRKIINNRGISCTGLLRFLEYKDLKVIWKETSMLNISTDSKFVRIATRVNSNANTETNNEGWINTTEFKRDYLDSGRNCMFKKLKFLEHFKDMLKSGEQQPFRNEEANSSENLPRISSVFSHLDLEISKTVDSENNPKKLLNTNPALHPKQLPKSKVNNIETSPMNITRVFSGVNNNTAHVDRNQVSRNDEKANANSMPIIQSTESLADLVKNGEATSSVPSENHATPSLNKAPAVLYPRIKVKDFSKLMPEKTTNNTFTIQSSGHNTENQNVLTYNDSSSNGDSRLNNYQLLYGQTSNFQPSNIVPVGQFVAHNDSMIVRETPKSNNTPKECIIMHTVELPNEKTYSPFQYLKNLLLIHNITLLDTDLPLPPESICLINLRYIYQQEKCDPITLTWSLFCIKSTFCIKVRDMQHRDISLSRLSPHWQWQLLRLSNTDVLNTILESARKISNETYNYTKNFFTLIQSIQCRTV